ncbi:MAG: Na+/H+ antiporter NhaA [Caulobacter sp.]|nr:Na+/H+ antiporter NhaA [Caulobacter sp.]
MDRLKPTAVVHFLKTEAGGGVLLALAAVAALIVANSPLADGYFALLKHHLPVDLGIWSADFTVKNWVKDGLMAIFFYVIGLELKRELTIGELSDPKVVTLPVAAAIGGALMPVALYMLLAGGTDPRGWPVPVATDIAFALAALAILAPNIDPRLRLFLLTLAVVDDLIAIILIAVLFTSHLAVIPLLAALALLAAVWIAQRWIRMPMWLYPVVGLITWALSIQAGVHSSVMAVAAAMIVPPRRVSEGWTVVGTLEHAIHPFSAYVVLPVFAFCAAGVSFAGLSLSQLTHGLPAAIAVGLALGKPLGVVGAYLLVARLIRSPDPFRLMDLLAIGALCGIGFTMSLFIGGLAFATDPAGEANARIGVLMGSSLALLLSILAFRLRPVREAAAEAQ